MFDALLCCVKVVKECECVVIGYKIVVAYALKSSVEFAEKWTKLDGADVRVPTSATHLKLWPPAELFQFREAKYDEYTFKRHQLAEDLPTVYKCVKENQDSMWYLEKLLCN